MEKNLINSKKLYKCKIKKIKKIEGLHKVYDLEVADNHNYFADGILVSNCQTYPDSAWVKFQSTQAQEGSIDRYFGTVDGRLYSPFHLINHRLIKFKGKRFFIPRMMEPWFDQQKKKDYIQGFGSEKSNEYLQQVLAEEGEPIWSLWSQSDILKNVNMLEAKPGVLANTMITLKISQADIDAGIEERVGKSKEPEVIKVALESVIAEYLSILQPPSKSLESILGIDVGWSAPTVILPLFFQNNKWNLRYKILLTDKMIPDYQAAIVDYVASLYNAVVGIDCSDGEGKALATSLTNPTRKEFAGKNYEERVVWIEFQKNMITGYKPDGEEITEKIKDKTTKILQSWFTEKMFDIYHDEDFLMEFDQERQRKTVSGNIIMTPDNVHIPEALRVFAFVWLEKHGKINTNIEEDTEEDYDILLPEEGGLDFGLFGRPGEKPTEGASFL